MAREKQARGEKLEKKIVEGIKELAAEAIEAKKKYVYNASQLSAHINVSRPTLAKHADVIEDTLKKIAPQKRERYGDGVDRLMQEKMERIESENESLKKELEVLRNHHAEIYLMVYHHAANLEPLIRPIVEEEMFEADRCILCHHPIEEIDPLEPLTPEPTKVIRFPGRKPEGNKQKKP